MLVGFSLSLPRLLLYKMAIGDDGRCFLVLCFLFLIILLGSPDWLGTHLIKLALSLQQTSFFPTALPEPWYHWHVLPYPDSGSVDIE